MPRFLFGIAGLLSLLGISPSPAAESPTSVTLQLPPPSLAQWYKPANERQVWLHTMFRLRRGLQAVDLYSRSGNRELASQWAKRLQEDYNRIGEMVPEWRDRLDPRAIETLLQAVREGDHGRLDQATQQLRTTCQDCHREYAPVTALLYRGPDFSTSWIDEQGYAEAMTGLSDAVNSLAIALADGDFGVAEEARGRLAGKLGKLGGSCRDCHQDDSVRERLLGTHLGEELQQLAQLITGQQTKPALRAVGEIAVSVCARCHAIHRTQSDLRRQLRETGKPQ